MTEDLQNEVEAINSIYGESSLIAASEHNVFVLRLPQHAPSLKLYFPTDYPATPPAVLGVESSGEHSRKGDAAHILEVFRDAVGRLYQPGEVCLFDTIEEVNRSLPAIEEPAIEVTDTPVLDSPTSIAPTKYDLQDAQYVPWTLSDVAIEMKSVFIARAAPVSSPDQARLYLQHLLDSDKKVRSATHNIRAWRIKGENGVAYQDCDDDGETAAGGRVLHLMQVMDIWNVMVVVTRWYGGHQLGPKRFSIINTVARDSFVKGGFVQEESSTAEKKGKR
ncbi:ribosomal protein S5 domain 2-type protein [Rhexocercosporidium sp. MPI-PUGE-AT-0058]|nr:ribosomal protein S5 domain 2-type protein [Rhexocercosporidium sp. MPI-PUGE-AT-0058]